MILVRSQNEMYQLAPTLHSGLLIKAVNVVLYGMRRNEQLMLDVFISLPLQDQFRNLLFTLRNVVFLKNSARTPLSASPLSELRRASKVGVLD